VLELIADGDAVEWSSAGLRAFRALLLVHAAVRTWAWVSLKPADMPLLELLVVWAFAFGMTAAAVLGLSARYARRAAQLATVLLACELYSSFPGTPNHVWLEFFCVALVGAFDVEGSDGRLLLVGLRWLAVIVLFHTGLQKLLNGYYVHGEFLVWAVSVQDRFADVFRPMLSADEVTRIATLDGTTPGTGPYRTGSPLFLVASNAVWILELVLPGLLVARASRVWAAVVAIAFLGFIQLAAREVLFAALITQLLLLLSPRADWNRRSALLYALLYVYILAYLLGLVPGDFLARGARGL